MDYRYESHAVYQIECHFVWITMYRYKILKGEVAERVRELVRQTCEVFEIRIVQGVVSKGHVPILVSCPPEMAPGKIMSRIEGRTSSYPFEEFPHLKKKYWGRHFWAQGYFCATGRSDDRRDDQTIRGESLQLLMSMAIFLSWKSVNNSRVGSKYHSSMGGSIRMLPIII